MQDETRQQSLDPGLADEATLFHREGARLAPAREPVAHVLLLHQKNAAARRIILDTLPLTIGRVAPAALILDGPTVSRQHCRLDLADDRIVLTDLQSTNGTSVNGKRLTAPLRLQHGAQIVVGEHRLTYERRSQRETAEARALDHELQEASRYVMSILPSPLDQGPVQAEWFYLPCTRIGGDVFGYQALDERSFAVFMVDVCGHGTGAALHAMTVANVLRQRLLPGVDFHDPAAIVRNLNRRFQMEGHNGMMFTLWLGVYDTVTRVLSYCAAGHHPAFLAPPPPQALVALDMRNPSIGMVPDFTPVARQTVVPPNSGLYLFSDGVFEIVGRDGRRWALSDITPLLRGDPAPQEPRRLYEAVRNAAQPGPLEDDFSLLLLKFL